MHKPPKYVAFAVCSFGQIILWMIGSSTKSNTLSPPIYILFLDPVYDKVKEYDSTNWFLLKIGKPDNGFKWSFHDWILNQTVYNWEWNQRAGLKLFSSTVYGKFCSCILVSDSETSYWTQQISFSHPPSTKKSSSSRRKIKSSSFYSSTRSFQSRSHSYYLQVLLTCSAHKIKLKIQIPNYIL